MWTLFRLLRELNARLEVNAVLLTGINAKLARLLAVPNPRYLFLTILMEGDGVLNYQIELPVEPEGFTDIASGELTLTVNDGASQIIPTAKGQLTVGGLSGAQGDVVTASFVFVDDAGNRSAVPATLNVVLADTFPPPDPSALGLTVTGETSDAPPA